MLTTVHYQMYYSSSLVIFFLVLYVPPSLYLSLSPSSSLIVHASLSHAALGDTSIPTISDCPSTIAVQASENLPGASVDWTVPTAVDNDGNIPQVFVSNAPGFFSIGTTTVTYTFRDTAGNEALCIFDVIVIGKNEIMSNKYWRA